ncbi:serine/threonine protein kinase [Candidatus Sumerlaeota bacterium]|nr:serine/threonine protein kinase [Candidatus Sumerlaeota bacterium]
MSAQPDKEKSSPSSKPMQVNEAIRSAFDKHNYELLGEIGRGGMGVVYLGQHRKLGRRVALKTLTPDRSTKENSIRRFHREAKTFAQIRHPNIANLFEFEDQGAVQFLALEYVEGTDLERERRKRRKWKYDEVAEIIAKLSDALDHTHKKGILHRDIKPGNILIEKNTNRVVLTDFGLAKGDQDESLTAAGFAVGTPAYMAPEQITDQFGLKPDGRADLFSLGTVAYEMLTHKHPFLASDDLNTMRNIVNGKVTPLRDVDPAIPPELAWILENMMEKDPKNRVPDAATLSQRLNTWLAKFRSGEGGFTPTTPVPYTPLTPAPTSRASGSTPQQAPSPTPARMPIGLIIGIVIGGVVLLGVGVAIGVVLFK